jgi:hypothetical protein
MWRTLTPVFLGDGQHAGGDDFNKLNTLLGGTLDVDTVDINSGWQFRSGKMKLANPANTFQYTFNTSAITAARTITVPLLTANDTLALQDFAQTITNKTINAASNTISGITDANIASHTSTKIAITAKAQLNSALVYNDQNNSFGAFYEDLSQISTPANPAAGTRRIFVDSATGKLSLRTSAGATVVLEPSTSAFTRGVSTQSGSGGSTYNIAHGLGSNPTAVSVTPGSHDANFVSGPFGSSGVIYYVTKDATNITVNYGTAPPSGSNNLVWHWVAFA